MLAGWSLAGGVNRIHDVLKWQDENDGIILASDAHLPC
jgi:hypothetical protein